MVKNIVIAVLAVALLVAGGFLLARPPLGAFSGREFDESAVLHGGLNYGSSGTASASTTAAQVCNNSLLSFAATNGAGNPTLPTANAVTVNCLRNIGDSKVVFFFNASTTAIRLYANTSTTIRDFDGTGGGATSTSIGIAGNGFAKVTFIRDNNGPNSLSVAAFGF